MDKDKKSPTQNVEEPKPGEGVRSLETWKKLARARAAMTNEQGEKGAADPAAYFQRFGLADLAPGTDSSTLKSLEGHLGAVDPVGELRVDARRGAVAVVGPAVLAVAYNKAGVGQMGVTVNIGVNLNLAKNVNETCGTGRPY